MIALSVKKLNNEALMPTRAYAESAAYDLYACLRSGGRSSTLTIPPNATKLIPTGLALQPFPGYCVLVCSRSGLATRGIFVANAPGVVDPDYTGEIQIILINAGMEPHYVKHGDRVGQALIVPFLTGDICEVAELPTTQRGEKGFGSTGE